MVQLDSLEVFFQVILKMSEQMDLAYHVIDFSGLF